MALLSEWPEAGEAAEQEDVPDGIQVGLSLREFQIADTGDFLLISS